jgi:glycosyltransferase involved in cell wall biosynthesis
VAGAKTLKIIILLPVYNESSTLKNELDRLKKLGDFIIMVNDGSADNSLEILEQFTKTNEFSYLINHKTNKGKSEALLNGFKAVLGLKAEGRFSHDDLLVITDADGQLPAQVIPEAVKFFNVKKLDMLIGARDFSQYPFIKQLGNKILSFAAGFLSGFSFKDTQCGFRILTMSALGKVLPYYTAKGYACEQQLSQIAVLTKLKVDNSFPVKPVYYRSNSTFADAFYIAADSIMTYLRIKFGKKKKEFQGEVLKPVLSNQGSYTGNKIEL